MWHFCIGIPVGASILASTLYIENKLQEWACEKRNNVYDCSSETVWEPIEVIEEGN